MRKSVLISALLGFFSLIGPVLIAIPASAQPLFPIDEMFCRTCHEVTVDFHHFLGEERGLDCLFCHPASGSPPESRVDIPVIRDCLECHSSEPHAISCRLCHENRRFEDYIGRGRDIHDEHKDRVICGICHTIPQTVNFGPRDRACGQLCHGGERIESAQQIHEDHMDRFDMLPNPCYWCHGKEVPPRPPLNNICVLCHDNRSGGRSVAHDRHAREFDCSGCHTTVAGFPDVRFGFNQRKIVCTVCHDPESGDAQEIHDKHVFGRAQCYACHGDRDVYASFRGEKDCTICHNPRDDRFTEVHEEHAGNAMMCAVCHTLMQPNVEGIRLSIPSSGLPTSPSNPPAVNRPPLASAGSDQTVALGSRVYLSASKSGDPDGTIEHFEWEFGNGEKASGMFVSYVYKYPATYPVVLKVTDNDGAISTAQVWIRVESFSGDGKDSDSKDDD